MGFKNDANWASIGVGKTQTHVLFILRYHTKTDSWFLEILHSQGFRSHWTFAFDTQRLMFSLFLMFKIEAHLRHKWPGLLNFDFQNLISLFFTQIWHCCAKFKENLSKRCWDNAFVRMDSKTDNWLSLCRGRKKVDGRVNKWTKQ